VNARGHTKPVTLAGLQIADRSGDITDAIQAAMELAGRRAHRGPHYYRAVTPVRPLRWTWKITDTSQSPHPILATGTSWTEGRAWKRLEKAYVRLLDGRAES
jgi:hypothetical protein